MNDDDENETRILNLLDVLRECVLDLGEVPPFKRSTMLAIHTIATDLFARVDTLARSENTVPNDLVQCLLEWTYAWDLFAKKDTTIHLITEEDVNSRIQQLQNRLRVPMKPGFSDKGIDAIIGEEGVILFREISKGKEPRGG
jgi:hypothetical protein